MIWASIIILLSQSQSFSKTPLRVVSLAQSITQNLEYLESDEFELVGCTSYCTPRKKTEVIASAIQVNIEKVVTLKPDLVLSTDITNPKTTDKLKSLGIRVENFSTARSFDEICEQFIRLGQLIGQKEEAISIIDQTRKKVETLRKKVPSGPSPKVFIQIGADPLYAVYPGLFMNDYITFSGGQNIAAKLTMGAISRESVLLSNPDLIFVVTMGVLGEQEKKNWEKMPQMNASKNHRIYIIDSNEACTPTPVTFASTLERIITLSYQQ